MTTFTLHDLEARVPLPRAFVIPGGTPAAAAVDMARTLVRRAERRAVALHRAGELENAEVLRYLNRCSDLLEFHRFAAGSGTAMITESSLLGTVCMIDESMPASSPARSMLPPLARLIPGCAPKTISVRPTRI